MIFARNGCGRIWDANMRSMRVAEMPVDLCAALTIVQVVLRLRPSTRAWSSSATMAATASCLDEFPDFGGLVGLHCRNGLAGALVI